MLDKMKDLGSQAVNKTGEALGGLGSTVKTGVEAIGTAAGMVGDAINEKAVRAATSQMYRVLELALEELKDRPLCHQAMTIKAGITVGLATLEIEIHRDQAQAEDVAESPSLSHGESGQSLAQ